MKKVWQLVAVAALMGTTIRTFADVQNIRISGDVRIRGYYLVNTGDNGSEDQLKSSAAFVSQRTRVTVEADLEDHVLVVVTLKAEGLWGDDDGQHESVGAGSPNGFNTNINRAWQAGVDEAYIQFNEMFYSAATLKLGRQYLHYGRGLIISSTEQEYNYDAARLVLDFYPLTIDIVGAMTENNQSFGVTPDHDGSSDLIFVNARYELTDSFIKNIEAYFGYLAQGSSGPVSSSRVPPSTDGASPMIVGLRSDMNLSENLQTWVEGAYEFGPDGDTGGSDSISAWLANVGAKFTFKDTKWTPILNANFIYASGGGSTGEHQFRPWFDYADGYNGYVFKPALSNIMIFNVGASVKPAENTTLSLQGYYYMAADTTPGHPGAGLVGNGNADNGGLGYSPSGSSRSYGWEIDSILGYDYSKDVRFQLVYGAFIPGNGFTYYPSDAVAHEVRAEVTAKF